MEIDGVILWRVSADLRIARKQWRRDGEDRRRTVAFGPNPRRGPRGSQGLPNRQPKGSPIRDPPKSVRRHGLRRPEVKSVHALIRKGDFCDELAALDPRRRNGAVNGDHALRSKFGAPLHDERDFKSCDASVQFMRAKIDLSRCRPSKWRVARPFQNVPLFRIAAIYRRRQENSALIVWPYARARRSQELGSARCGQMRIARRRAGKTILHDAPSHKK